MFVKEFFFSFSLLAFTGLLMIVGVVLLVDALRRFVVDGFKSVRPKVARAPAVVMPLAAPQRPEEKLPTLEEAA
jgi:hypothetical protein